MNTAKAANARQLARKTKIIATIGPATSSPERIRDILLAGVNVIRMNFSHGSHEAHQETLDQVRKVAAELDIDTSILSKIERSERVATIEMLPTLAKTLEVQEKEMEIEFIKAFILSDLGELKFLKRGLEETLNTIKSRK